MSRRSAFPPAIRTGKLRPRCSSNRMPKIVWFLPHMHLRGKDMTYQLEFPSGEKRIVLGVPRYDFNWPFGYQVDQPIKVPKGTKMLVTAHFDNSAHSPTSSTPIRIRTSGGAIRLGKK